MTSCFWCAKNVSAQTEWLGRSTSQTIRIAFIAYGAAHFLEPLLRASIVEPEPCYLVFFILKPFVFLSVTAAATVEAHTLLETTNKELAAAVLNLGESQAKVFEQQRSFGELVQVTNHAFFRDSLDGTTLVSVGEEGFLGEAPRPGARRAMFVNTTDYDDLIRDVRAEMKIGPRDFTLKQLDGTVRTVRLHARVREANPAVSTESVIEGFYHDITDDEVREHAKTTLAQKADEILTLERGSEALAMLAHVVSELVDCDSAVYIQRVLRSQAAEFELCVTAGPAIACAAGGWTHEILDGFLALGPDLLRDPSRISTDVIAGVHNAGLGLVEDAAMVFLPIYFDEAIATQAPERARVLGFVVLASPAPWSQTQIVQLTAVNAAMDRLRDACVLVQMKETLAGIETLRRSFGENADIVPGIQRSLERLVVNTAYDALALARPLAAQGNEGGGRQIVSWLPQLTLAERVSTDALRSRTIVESILARGKTDAPAGRRSATVHAAIELTSFDVAGGDGVVLANLIAVHETSRGANTPHALDALFLDNVARYMGLLLAQAEAQRAYRRALARVGHDLRNIVASVRDRVRWMELKVRGLSGLAAEALQRVGFTDKLGDLESNADALKHLAQIIDFFRTEKPRETPKPTLVFKDVVQKCCKETRFWFIERNLVPPEPVSSDFDCVPRISVAQTAFDRVVRNLLINSAKYSTEANKTRPPKIFAQVAEEHYTIVFQDWGIGVNPEERDKIFEEGFRGAAVRHTSFGDGLGLYIAQSLAESDLNGHLVLSNLRNPTEFRLQIPRSRGGRV
jgi:signal transduction histidine kinase